jgi:hypothetical protein
MASKLSAAAQRIALAEKILAEQIAEVMAKAAQDIEGLCHLSIRELLVRFQADESRGPEPRIHCVIVAANFPDGDEATAAKLAADPQLPPV